MNQPIKRFRTMSNKALHFAIGLCMMGLFACSGDQGKKPEVAGADSAKGPVKDTSIKLPAGFSASTVAQGFGKARHIAVAPNGVIFVKLGSEKDGKGIYRLQDTNGDGLPDQITGFGNYGGTCIAIKNGYLYASSNTEVYRYKLDSNFNVISTDS